MRCEVSLSVKYLTCSREFDLLSCFLALVAPVYPATVYVLRASVEPDKIAHRHGFEGDKFGQMLTM